MTQTIQPLIDLVNQLFLKYELQLPFVIIESISILIILIVYSFVWSIIGRSWSKVDQVRELFIQLLLL